jgi:acyl-CoA synthetase (AMP-forming)/AMP-acid ligase II
MWTLGGRKVSEAFVVGTCEPPVAAGRMTTLADIPRYQAEVRPNEVALEFEGRLTTFGEFDRHTSQVANALIAEGLSKGDRIAYIGKNSDHFFELLFGAAKAGVVMAPVGWRLAPPEAAYIVGDTGAKLLFVGSELVETARYIAGEQPELKLIAMEPVEDGWRTFEAWRDAQPDTDVDITVEVEDVALQLYTSGTTGRPKGAMLRNVNLRGNWMHPDAGTLGWNTWTPEDVSLVAMPVAHIGGAGWGIVGLSNGARGVVVREFDPTKILDFIERHRISKLFMVPAALQFVVRQPKAREVDYSRLQYILYGASPMPIDLLRECMEVFGCGFCQLYGMTETSGAVVYLPPEDHDPKGSTRMRSAGLPMPGVEIRVVDEAGNDVPTGAVGEVIVRSIANMAGYWRLPEATASTMGEDGWLRTGDAGYLDEDGYLFIHDRVKDMIITGGENVYPAEVENAIFGHPDVAEAAVIGVPDEQWGEAVKAIVALKPGAKPDPASIIAFARTRIAAFKAPKSVDFIDVLPRNASGKILRRELREPYWAGKARRVN